MIKTSLARPVIIGDLEIEATERTEVCVEHVAGVIVATATKEPVAVVIRTPAGTITVDLVDLQAR